MLATAGSCCESLISELGNVNHVEHAGPLAIIEHRDANVPVGTRKYGKRVIRRLSVALPLTDTPRIREVRNRFTQDLYHAFEDGDIDVTTGSVATLTPQNCSGQCDGT